MNTPSGNRAPARRPLKVVNRPSTKATTGGNMKMRILDQEFGRADGFSYDLETWVEFDGDSLVVARVHYDVNHWSASSATVTLIDTEVSGGETAVVLRDFPLRWWGDVPKNPEDMKTAPEVLRLVTARLLARMTAVLDDEDSSSTEDED